ncbi:MAG TPA: iron uptake transporter permease EfeU [Candidatus Limnocylindrales bacterium]|jgi:high-affinity iron transporter
MFEPGFFVSGLLIGLREGVEAALIVAIILAYLARTGNARFFGRLWLGVGAAVVLSVGIGVGLFATIGGLVEPYEQLFEAMALLVATAVVTWMLFWMRRQAASVRGELHAAVDRALTSGGAWALTALAFSAVIREGVETALFLSGTATSADEGALSVAFGALVGLALAVIIGFGFYRGARIIDLRIFFKWTGIALIFIAGGLLSRAVHELVEIGVIGVGSSSAFDISGVLPHEQGIGQFLRAIFGYSSQPEWATFVTWLVYVVVVLVLYLRPVQPAAPKPVEVQPAA